MPYTYLEENTSMSDCAIQGIGAALNFYQCLYTDNPTSLPTVSFHDVCFKIINYY